ncbi:Cell wall-associated polypeptide CWBP200 [Pragia fontium]|uniref:RHS repeat domain-containing protein n=1 Tax=Pragia fontium TaxID=82985 RepID=UPI000E03FEA4|nr:RHS repeat-associated core domain-containing protein [Pragia fontium]SUB84221.1 Cell wall-associated polypeptide CWBP200 [Pragia fontium]
MAAEVSFAPLSDKTEAKLDARFFVYYLNTFEPLILQCKQQGIGSLAPPDETGYYFYQNDPNGMPLRLHDAQGEIVWSAHYTVFGQTDKLDEIKVKQPLRLQGQYFDEESGLHYNRHRYYDPATGVFVSQDPIGLVGGINPYQYAPNTFGWIDPLGLTKKTQTLAEWLKDSPALLDEARDKFKTEPQWQGIDPDKTPVFYRTKAEVDEIRKKKGESGGHHPHGLALGGDEGQELTETNETRKCKNPKHSAATGLQMRIINVIKPQL